MSPIKINDIPFEHPNDDDGEALDDFELMHELALCLDPLLDDLERTWNDAETGDIHWYVMRRDQKTLSLNRDLEEFFVILFEGRESWVANLTRDEAVDIVAEYGDYNKP